MKKDFIVSKIESSEDGSPYVFVTFTDRNEPRSAGNGGEAIPFTSPEDLMKNLPKVMSNMYDAGGGMPGKSPIFKITMKEYEDMAIMVGDRVGMVINKVNSGGI
ncbi:MAG: hypothetical protein WAM88_14410 [Nitrososphaeraceae archaeon]